MMDGAEQSTGQLDQSGSPGWKGSLLNQEQERGLGQSQVAETQPLKNNCAAMPEERGRWKLQPS